MLTFNSYPVFGRVMKDEKTAHAQILKEIMHYGYSKKLGRLVISMLRLDPKKRPKARNILQKFMKMYKGINTANTQDAEQILDPIKLETNILFEKYFVLPGINCIHVNIILGEQVGKEQSMLSSFFSVMLGSGKYGSFSYMLHVGACMIEVLSHDSVVIHPVKHASPRMVIPLGQISDIETPEIKALLKGFCQKIADIRNGKAGYTFTVSPQAVFTDLISTLKLKEDWRHHFAIDTYVTNMIMTGLSFKMFAIHPVTKKKFIFSTHEELDNYVNEILESQPEYAKLQTFELLKAFDRTWWLGFRYYGSTNPEKEDIYKPHSCPFGSPFDSHEYIDELNIRLPRNSTITQGDVENTANLSNLSSTSIIVSSFKD